MCRAHFGQHPTSLGWRSDWINYQTYHQIGSLRTDPLYSSTNFRYFEIQKTSLPSKHFPNTHWRNPAPSWDFKTLWNMRCSPHQLVIAGHLKPTVSLLHQGTSSHFNSFRISDLRSNKWQNHMSFRSTINQLNSLKMSEPTTTPTAQSNRKGKGTNA